MLRGGAVLVAFLVLAIAAPAHSEGTRTESEPYAAGTTFAGGNTATRCVTMANVADACFGILPGDYGVTIAIEDVSGLPVGGAAKFYDASFVFVGATGTFCGGASALVPSAAAYLVVYPQFFASTATACDTNLNVQHGAKAGFVTVTFT